ncbi:hypothetical protein [Moorena sp. SIO3I8]|uniref:hypothetical protein n=1 Tax=Moorena sp. SIO3I8 TaxID=2607833 RepID=UPI0034409A17
MFIHDQQGLVILADKQANKQAKKEAKQEIARKLLPLLDDETISQTTGIAVEEIQKLREG